MRIKVHAKLALSGLATLAALMIAGCGSGSSSMSSTSTATPTFSPGAGTYNASQTVTISDSTNGAVLYCTTDGSTPTTSSPKCSQPTTVYQTEFLQAIAVAPGGSPSAVASAAYTIDLSAAATPAFSPAGGIYTAPQTVTISDATTGANIYYTTDGSMPSPSSKLYTGPITVSASETVSAIAIASGYSNSGIASATFAITTPVATPAFSVPSGSYPTAQTVTITDATANAAIYYTTDGSTPTSSSTAYTAPISVTQTETISSIAILDSQSSQVAVAAYVIGQVNTSVAAPTFSLAAGTYTSAQTVTLADTTDSAAIYYTTDGSAPTSSSTAYTGPINVTRSETISAIAIAAGVNSPVVTATYTIALPVATPAFSVPSGSYTTPQSVSITDATPGATIYYTLDGSTPSSSSTSYTAAINVSKSETITAIAILGGSSSQIVSAAYNINQSVAAPVFSVTSGTYSSPQTVSITDATPNANIYYTLNGSTPSASSTLYSAPINISQSETISAIAILGANSSAVTTATYTITQPVAAPVFSVPTGSYTSAQSVTITDATPNTTIYYAINNTAPTTSSILYSGAINVTQTETVSAIAVLGPNTSAVTTVAYAIGSSVASPAFAPPSGSAVAVGQAITITAGNASAVIYYTTDGTTPTSASTKYTAPVPLNSIGTATIDAVAIQGPTSSSVSIATYTVKQPTPAPTFNPAGGSPIIAGQTVSLADSDANAIIYYTLDGSTPTASSTKYTAPVKLSTEGSVTINAMAIDSGLSSTIATASYTVSPANVATPTFNPVSGSPIIAGQTVTLADSDANATIYYTMDGSTPSATSTKYTAPIALSTPGSTTIKAIAIDGATSSSIATATYTVSPASVAAPTFTPATGTSLSVGQTVTIADTDTNATIYYTIDGSTPSAASTQYTAPIALTTAGAATIKAIAIDGATSSTVATATYTVVGAGPSISGSVLSGTTPISGAQVQLFAAGIAAGDAGYGSSATAVGSPVTTSASGTFTLNVNCPASPGDLTYLVATGGNSGSGANASIELMTALGPCANLTSQTTITINEVTTVASAYALSQFMTTAPNVGSSSTNYQGLTRAFATVSNLVNVTTGVSPTHTPAYPTDLTGDTPIVNNSTVPQARINTLADMLNACTATDGGGCSTLFAAAAPPSGSAPTNTLQAILDVAQNPGANPAALFAVASASGPFQPELGGAPNDWMLALTFTGGGLGISPATVPAVTYPFAGTPTTGPLAIVNTSLAIDAQGNVWVTAYADNTPTFEEPGNSQATLVAEFSNLGAPITPAATLSSDATPVLTFGGFDPDPTNTDALTASAIDGSGNVWLGDFTAGDLYQISGSLATLQGPLNLGNTINSITINASGSVWSAASSHLYEYSNTGNQLLTSDGSGTAFPNLSYSNLSYLAFDSSGGLWGADFANTDLYSIATTTGSIAFDLFGTGSGPGSGFDDITLAADGAGNIYGCGESGGQNLDVFESGAQTNSYPIATGRGCGNQLVLDGQGHLFAISNVNTGTPVAAVDELTLTGAAISGTNGYTGTSAGEPPTLNPDANYFFPVPGISAAIDTSGNLWVLNNDSNGLATPGNVLVEFIGIGAPVVTPTSVALQNGQLGSRP